MKERAGEGKRQKDRKKDGGDKNRVVGIKRKIERDKGWDGGRETKKEREIATKCCVKVIGQQSVFIRQSLYRRQLCVTTAGRLANKPPDVHLDSPSFEDYI